MKQESDGLEPMWHDFCTEVSATSFFVIAAEALIKATGPTDKRVAGGLAGVVGGCQRLY